MRAQRQRRETGPLALAVLRPLLRYSATRDAWVLRFIGNTKGPVLVKRSPAR